MFITCHPVQLGASKTLSMFRKLRLKKCTEKRMADVHTYSLKVTHFPYNYID